VGIAALVVVVSFIVTVVAVDVTVVVVSDGLVSFTNSPVSKGATGRNPIEVSLREC